MESKVVKEREGANGDPRAGGGTGGGNVRTNDVEVSVYTYNIPYSRNKFKQQKKIGKARHS